MVDKPNTYGVRTSEALRVTERNATTAAGLIRDYGTMRQEVPILVPSGEKDANGNPVMTIKRNEAGEMEMREIPMFPNPREHVRQQFPELFRSVDEIGMPNSLMASPPVPYWEPQQQPAPQVAPQQSVAPGGQGAPQLPGGVQPGEEIRFGDGSIGRVVPEGSKKPRGGYEVDVLNPTSKEEMMQQYTEDAPVMEYLRRFIFEGMRPWEQGS